jgi:alpha-glucoside transport system permease protein
MGGLFGAFVVALLGIAAYVVLVGMLYGVTLALPEGLRERAQSVVFVGPALFLLFAGLMIPAARTIYLSFFTGTSGREFAGLDNYQRLFTERDNLIILRNNFLWILLVTAFSTAVGLTIARLADGMKGESLAKALIFLPTAISLVGAGIIWKFIYAYNGDSSVSQIGLLNQIWVWLDPVLPGKQEPVQWLLETSTWFPLNTLLLIVVMVWVQAGFATVVFSAAIKAVDDSLLEAARIDGATERQIFFKVQVPAIMPTIVTVLTTTIIAVLKVFDVVRAMTGGNFETEVLANDMFDKSFREGNPGYGAALAVILFIAVIPIVYINIRNLRLSRENR